SSTSSTDSEPSAWLSGENASTDPYSAPPSSPAAAPPMVAAAPPHNHRAHAALGPTASEAAPCRRRVGPASAVAAAAGRAAAPCGAAPREPAPTRAAASAAAGTAVSRTPALAGCCTAQCVVTAAMKQYPWPG